MSVNKCIFVGNCGKDPEIKHLDNNVSVANFSLATTEKGYTSKSGQEIPDRTEWINIVVWRGLANVVEKYVKKGSQLYVEGKLRTRSYDDKDGNKRYVTEVYADNLQLLGSKPSQQPQSDNSNVSLPQPESDNGGDDTDGLPF